MFIRKTKIKSASHGEPYYTYRIVETSRTNTGVKQRTLLNLGKHFDVDPSLWALLSKRVEDIIQMRATTHQTLEQIIKQSTLIA